MRPLRWLVAPAAALRGSPGSLTAQEMPAGDPPVDRPSVRAVRLILALALQRPLGVRL